MRNQYYLIIFAILGAYCVVRILMVLSSKKKRVVSRPARSTYVDEFLGRFVLRLEKDAGWEWIGALPFRDGPIRLALTGDVSPAPQCLNAARQLSERLERLQEALSDFSEVALGKPVHLIEKIEFIDEECPHLAEVHFIADSKTYHCSVRVSPNDLDIVAGPTET